MSDKANPCFYCEGSGEIYTGPSCAPDSEPWESCKWCDGTGEMPGYDQVIDYFAQGYIFAHLPDEVKKLRGLSGNELTEQIDFLMCLVGDLDDIDAPAEAKEESQANAQQANGAGASPHC